MLFFLSTTVRQTTNHLLCLYDKLRDLIYCLPSSPANHEVPSLWKWFWRHRCYLSHALQLAKLRASWRDSPRSTNFGHPNLLLQFILGEFMRLARLGIVVYVMKVMRMVNWNTFFFMRYTFQSWKAYSSDMLCWTFFDLDVYKPEVIDKAPEILIYIVGLWSSSCYRAVSYWVL